MRPTSVRPIRTTANQRLLVSVRARAALAQFVRERGPQRVLLSWPAGATTLPASIHDPGPHDVIVGHVAKCPIFADVRQLGLYRDRRILLDIPAAPSANRRPILRLQKAVGARPSRT